MKTLSVDNVSKSFHRHQVLEDVSFKLEPNKIYGLLGRNGAGKSTLLNIMTNRIFATSGEVQIDDESVFENDQALSDMYLMSEVNMYNDHYKVDKIFKQAELSYGSFDWENARKLTQKFGVRLDEKFGGLSTGYHSIVKLIIALSVPVHYVFFDEPVLGLDANHRELFYQELLESYENNPRTIVISTHLIEEVASIVEHVIIIQNGRVELNDEVEKIVGMSYAVTGPEPAVTEYTKGLNVIGHDNLGGLRTNYIYGKLNDSRVIPDTVKIKHIDLQKLFVNLTEGDGEIVQK